jgi:hypothetical protein
MFFIEHKLLADRSISVLTNLSLDSVSSIHGDGQFCP